MSVWFQVWVVLVTMFGVAEAVTGVRSAVNTKINAWYVGSYFTMSAFLLMWSVPRLLEFPWVA